MADFDHSSTPPRSMAHRKAMEQFAVPKRPSAQIQHELAHAFEQQTGTWRQRPSIATA